jgi:YVTN family beta-propeller protein
MGVFGYSAVFSDCFLRHEPTGEVDEVMAGGNRSRVRAIGVPVLAALFLAIVVPSATAQYAYVTNETSNSVSVINTQNNRVVGPPISVGGGPFSIAITPDGRSAYVASLGLGYVSVVDTQLGQVTGSSIPVGQYPDAIAINPDGTRAYVASMTGTVSVINTKTRSLVGSPIPVGEQPEGIAVTPDGGSVYVTNWISGSVSVIDTQTNEVAGPPIDIGGHPSAIAISPDGKDAYVANWSGSVSVIDTMTNETVGAPIIVGEHPAGIAITPDGKSAYVVNHFSGTVSMIDTQTREAGAEIAVGMEFPWEIAISPNGKSAYVTGVGTTSGVAVIDTQTDETVGSPITVGFTPSGIAITPFQPAHASFTAPAAREGLPLRFNASASTYAEGSTPAYEWDFGDGGHEQNGGPTPTHTYDAPGSYMVTLTVTDDLCAAKFVFTGQTAYCNGAEPVSSSQRILVAGPPTDLTVTLSPTSIAADGKSTTAATARLTDARGIPVPGDTLAFSSTDSGERVGAVHESTDGVYAARITSSMRKGTATIIAADRSASPPLEGSATLSQVGPNPFRLGKIQHMRATGLARLTVVTPSSGTAILWGPSVVTQRVPALAGSFKVLIAPRGRAARELQRSGKKVVSASVAFVPTVGATTTERLKVKLIRRR